jgi:DNA-binding NarL/FixJ family response regulator
MEQRTRILIVDDHPIVCEGLTQLISHEADLEVVGDARDAGEALKKIEDLQPDFVIVDISLTGKSGIDLMAEIRARHDHILMLALSMHGEALYVERALKAGARGYVTKGDATTVIVKAIRRILGGGIYVNEQISGALIESLYANQRGPRKTAVERLSPREFEVFRLIGEGMKNHEIAEILGVSVKTVDAHREHIRDKLQVKDAHELFSYALEWTRTGSLGNPPMEYEEK